NPSAAEISEICERNSLNVAHGLAWSYYIGYLKIILPYLKDSIRVFNENNNCLLKCKKTWKLHILIPLTCEVYDSLGEADSRIQFISNLPEVSVDRAGIKRRTYKHSVYEVLGENKKTHYCVVEYATPLQSLHAMSQDDSAAFSRQARLEQAKLFCRTLEEILEKSKECSGCYQLIVYDDSGENDKHFLSKEILRHLKQQDQEEYAVCDKEDGGMHTQECTPVEDTELLISDFDQPLSLRSTFHRTKSAFKGLRQKADRLSRCGMGSQAFSAKKRSDQFTHTGKYLLSCFCLVTEWTELKDAEEEQVEEIMAALRILTILWLLGDMLPHDESKNLESANTTLPDFSSLNQTSGGEPSTTSLPQSAGKSNSSPTVNVYGALVTSAKRLQITNTEEFLVTPTTTEEKSALSVAATGVTSFIVILVVVVVTLAGAVSLKLRCCHCKDVEDKQKHQQLAVSYSLGAPNEIVGKHVQNREKETLLDSAPGLLLGQGRGLLSGSCGGCGHCSTPFIRSP
ncbi:PREDICTED: uncharacterized protein LOC107107713, partial [Gekko japonicus]|uniref:Stimulator of interferon genes protein n=1 Tax=Gekko japonicus TaxID=146911 RepID=A0ABM1JPX8_GEKJA